jgi:hypothetical protein
LAVANLFFGSYFFFDPLICSLKEQIRGSKKKYEPKIKGDGCRPKNGTIKQKNYCFLKQTIKKTDNKKNRQ